MNRFCAVIAVLVLPAAGILQAAPIHPDAVRGAHAWSVINRGSASDLTFNDSAPPTSWDTATPTPSGDSRSAVLTSPSLADLKWRESQNLPAAGQGVTAYMVWKPGAGLLAGTNGDTDNYTVMEFRAAGYRINVMGHSVGGTTHISMRDKQGAKPWFVPNVVMGGSYTVPVDQWMHMWLQVDAAGQFKAYDVSSGVPVLMGSGTATGGSGAQFTIGDESSGSGKDSAFAVDEIYIRPFVDVALIPEPATLGLLVFGGLPLVLRRRR